MKVKEKTITEEEYAKRLIEDADFQMQEVLKDVKAGRIRRVK